MRAGAGEGEERFGGAAPAVFCIEIRDQRIFWEYWAEEKKWVAFMEKMG